MAAQCPKPPSLDPFQEIPEMLSAMGVGLWAQEGSSSGR